MRDLHQAYWKKIIALGGEPATGKTTVIRMLIDHMAEMGAFQTFTFGKLQGHAHPESKIIILGVYKLSETFAGTDRLAISVHQDAKRFLTSSRQTGFRGYSLIFEGDRLFAKDFLKDCKATASTDLIVVKASKGTLRRRHIERADDQTESWLRQRAAKVADICKTFHDVEYWENESKRDLNSIVIEVGNRLGLKGFGG